jgi:hypothetical protein
MTQATSAAENVTGAWAEEFFDQGDSNPTAIRPTRPSTLESE